jgi:murein peptide amidase A
MFNVFKVFIALACLAPHPRIYAQTETPPNGAVNDATVITKDYLADFCTRELSSFPGPYEKDALAKVCGKMQILDGCQSVNGDPIFHYDKEVASAASTPNKKILVISLIHGDETPATSVARAWVTRLERIDPRNSWRVIPIANPDGNKARTRTNANKVDLNRNFPSEHWDREALHRWKIQTKSDPRRYPGPKSGSEPETQCLVSHLSKFKPDFIISVHTPLGVLDFDGPKVKNPSFSPLPWVSLGNYPGSLGRYMWVNNKVPVLTIELKGNDGLKKLEEFDRLQDITGTIAIQADQMIKKPASPNGAKKK